MTGLTPLQRYLLNPAAATHALLHQVLDAVRGAAPFGVAVLTASIAAVLAWKSLKQWQQRRLTRDGRCVAILPPPEVDAAGAAVLWSNLVALLRPALQRGLTGQPHLSFEYCWSEEGLRISAWVPRCVPPGLVERAIESAWPGCRTAPSAPTEPIPLEAAVTGGTLRLAQPEWFPLNTTFEVDPLRAVLGAAGQLGGDEHAAVQILARPATGRRVARCFRAAGAIRSGRSLGVLARALDLLSPRPVRTAAGTVIDLSAAQDVRLILSKAAAPLYEVLVRYAVSSGSTSRRGHRVLRGRAHTIASSFAVFTGRNRFARRRLRLVEHVLAQRRMGRGDLLSVQELAVLAHLPSDRAVPGLARAGARSVAPPPGVPREGRILGDAETGQSRPVALAVADGRYHVHVMGATGTGKSTLLTNLVLDDVAAGRGVVAIDPKGDLVTDILDRLPSGAADRVVLIDAEERVAPPTLNVLSGADADLVVDNVVGIFQRIFERFWGPRTDDVLRAACLTLLAGGREATIAEVPTLLTNERFRRQRIRGVKEELSGFWSWYEAMGEAQRSQVIGPVMNKLRAFLLRDFVRRVVGSGQSSFDMARVLDGGICLVRVPKGLLGEETARLLGSFVVASVWQAVTARAQLGKEVRVDASLYVDECQNFLTLPRSFDEMLAEARGYGLSLVLAHQHLGQLPVSLREAISTNARTKLFFALSPEDARVLERHVAPELSAHDLSHLGAYQAAARLVVAGAETPAFTLHTRPAPAAIPGRADHVREVSRRRYGRMEQKSEATPSNRAGHRTGATTQPVRSRVRSGVAPAIPSVEEPLDVPPCS